MRHPTLTISKPDDPKGRAFTVHLVASIICPPSPRPALEGHHASPGAPRLRRHAGDDEGLHRKPPIRPHGRRRQPTLRAAAIARLPLRDLELAGGPALHRVPPRPLSLETRSLRCERRSLSLGTTGLVAQHAGGAATAPARRSRPRRRPRTRLHRAPRSAHSAPDRQRHRLSLGPLRGRAHAAVGACLTRHLRCLGSRARAPDPLHAKPRRLPHFPQ